MRAIIRIRIRLGLLVLLASTATTAVQAAPPAPAPAAGSESSPAITDAARARFAEGVKLYGKKRYDKAFAAFLQAYALTKNPAVLINLGLTSSKMGNPVQAARYFDKFQKEAKEPTPDQKTRAQNGLAEARRSLGAIEAVTVAIGAVTKVRLAAQRPTATPNAVLEPESRGSGGSSADGSSPNDGAAGGGAGGAAGSGGNGRSEGTGVFSPPNTTWPVYTAGAIGLVSLTAAIVLSGISTNASRNVSNASDALTRAGKSPDACADPSSVGDATIGSTCSTLRSGQRTSDDVKSPLIATAVIGVGATAVALGWYFFAPKGHDAAPAVGVLGGPLRVTPQLGAHGETGASFDLRF
jgi:hypothetical protein